MVIRHGALFMLSGAYMRAVAKCGLPLVPRAVETAGQVAAFVGRHADAQRLTIDDAPSVQLFPHADHDGFFYALLQKN